MDDGEEKIDDAAILAQVGRQARKVYLQSVVASVGLALIFVLIPAS